MTNNKKLQTNYLNACKQQYQLTRPQQIIATQVKQKLQQQNNMRNIFKNYKLILLQLNIDMCQKHKNLE